MYYWLLGQQKTGIMLWRTGGIKYQKVDIARQYNSIGPAYKFSGNKHLAMNGIFLIMLSYNEHSITSISFLYISTWGKQKPIYLSCRRCTSKALFTLAICLCVKHQELVLWQQVMVFMLNICIWRQRKKQTANANVECEQGLTLLFTRLPNISGQLCISIFNIKIRFIILVNLSYYATI